MRSHLPQLIGIPLLLAAIAPSVGFAQTALTPGATTVQLPTFGVSIDAAGLLEVRSVDDPTGALRAARVAQARATLPADVQTPAPLRMVSLVRLERAWRKRVEAGAAADDVMRHLAGLTNIRYALLLPAGDATTGDILLAGEAEGWCDDGLGRAVGLKTGRPVLRLDDLQTALTAYLHGSAPDGGPTRAPTAGDAAVPAGFVGCTIDPTLDGLERMQRLRSEIPRTIRDAEQVPFAAELDRRTREALGPAQVRIFGIPAESHLAAVLVEADYRMKRIAVGVEPPPVRLPSYVDRATGAPASAVQRYWFVPDYARLQTDAARESLEFLGRGLKLQTEDVTLKQAGVLETARSRDPAATSFCADFTRRYDEIAARSPVFAELRSTVDLLVAAAFLRQHDWPRRADWRPTLLVDRTQSTLAPQSAKPTVAPQSAPVVVNTAWKGRRLISAAGGGVSITPAEALRPEHLREVDAGHFAEPRGAATPPAANDRWWWD